MNPGESKYTSSGKDRVNIDPNAQMAFEKLVAKEQKSRTRKRIIGFLVVLLIITAALPWSFSFYCSQIIGSNYEVIILRKYPGFTEKIIRAAVITDNWYLNAFSPILNKINSKEDIEQRKAVIELGLEATSEREPDSEKIQNLRAIVAASLLKSPSGIAFAVYEHPPRKAR